MFEGKGAAFGPLIGEQRRGLTGGRRTKLRSPSRNGQGRTRGVLALVALAVVFLAIPAAAHAADRLTSNQRLYADQSITSQNSAYTLIMQRDGNLVAYDKTGAQYRALWSSRTAGNSGAWAVMQGDGNLVVYTAASRVLWASNTQGNPGAYARMQSDGNLVVYNAAANRALWSSNTVQPNPPPDPQPTPTPTPTPPATGSSAGAFEPNDTIPTAFGPLTSGAAYAAQLETKNDVDYFRMHTSGQTQLLINLTETTPAQNCFTPDMTLISSSGERLEYENASSEQITEMSYSAPGPSTYYLMLTARFVTCPAPVAQYSLRVSASPPLAAGPVGPSCEAVLAQITKLEGKLRRASSKSQKQKIRQKLRSARADKRNVC